MNIKSSAKRDIVPKRVKALKRAISDEDKDLRRTEILSAAKRVFASKGFHSTTIADVAKAAKISYGSIYWYYDSKDVLFQELMSLEERSLMNSIADALAKVPDSSPADIFFRVAVKTTFEFFENDKDAVRLIFRDSYALGGDFETHLSRIYENFVSDIEESVKKAQERKEIINTSPKMIAFSIAALIGQVAHRRLITDDGLSAEEAADFIVNLLLFGLVPRTKEE
jgi:AcrR family transcriptional regulator